MRQRAEISIELLADRYMDTLLMKQRHRGQPLLDRAVLASRDDPLCWLSHHQPVSVSDGPHMFDSLSASAPTAAIMLYLAIVPCVPSCRSTR